MNQAARLQPGQYYHIYNRGNNYENLFYEDRNYQYFLKLYASYIFPVADTYTYCLMGNHFHLLVRIKMEQEYFKATEQQFEYSRSKLFNPSKSFSNLFNAYTKAMNKERNRSGSLFQKPFKRRMISSDSYFQQLVFYIHFNPQKHGFVEDFRNWKWSSYRTLVSEMNTRLCRDEVLQWFGGSIGFNAFHQGKVDEALIHDVIEKDE